MSVPAINIKVGADDISNNVEIISVDVHAEFNKIPWAEICILDGDAASRKFEISDSKLFDLGKMVTINLGFVEDPASVGTVFKGVVTRHAIEMDARGQMLRIECRHPSFLMTKVRQRKVFADKKDDDLFADLAKSSLGLCKIKADGIKGVMHPQMVQYDATDWDFLMSRCAANGWLVLADGADLSIRPIAAPKGSPIKEAALNFLLNEVFSLELALESEGQFEKAVVKAYDLPGELPKAEFAGTSQIGPGNSKPEAITSVSKKVELTEISAIALEEAEGKAWAQGLIDRSRMSYYRGRFEVNGSAKIKLGASCKIEGAGSKFDGTATISGLRHRVSTTGWYTDVQIGMPKAETQTSKNIMSQPANGLVPGVNGLQFGIVQEVKEIKGKGLMVLVYLPALDLKTNVIWARLGMPFGGKNAGKPYGMLFWPEKDDEVIVGFANDDPRAAVVLGSLYNSQSKFPFEWDKENAKKGLCSKSGSKIEFDDKEKEITISTIEQGTLVTLSESKKNITITEKTKKGKFELSDKGVNIEFDKGKFSMDEKGITLTMDKDTITMDSNGIAVKSEKKLLLNGGKGAVLNGKSQVDIVGSKINLK